MTGPLSRALVIPAAGRGSRLGADRPKLLVSVNGRPMLDHLVDLYRPYVERFILVINPSAEDSVRACTAGRHERFSLVAQPSPTGMLDAMLLAGTAVADSGAARVWITWADQVAVHPATVSRLAEEEAAHPSPIVLPTIERQRPYTFLERDASGRISAARYQREGDPMPETGECEIGLFSLSAAAFLEDLPAFSREAMMGASTGERNFLPFIPWISARGGEVRTFPAVEDIEAIGINTREELARIEAHLLRRTSWHSTS